MGINHTRKKDPAVVRGRLLYHAAVLAIDGGITKVTIQSVAEAAGVTTGGLLHHFANKQSLLEAMFEHLLEQYDGDIDQLIAEDPCPAGVFTRAYVRMAIPELSEAEQKLRAAIYVCALGDPAMQAMWASWLRRRLARHADTDADPTLEIIRLAADGIWLASLARVEPLIADVPSLIDRLIKLTHEGSPARSQGALQRA